MPRHPKHADFREDSYRGTYWNPPPGKTTEPGSPVSNERLRNQLIQKDRVNQSASFKGRVGKPKGVNKFADDPLNRSMSETGGTLRSLPTQIADKPTTVNINHLRGGQRSYPAKTNIDNFVEERFDVNYLSGKTAFEKKSYESTYMANMREAQKVYLDSQKKTMVAKLPKLDFDFRSSKWPREGILNYARTPNNAMELEGRYWVGTAPAHMYKSMNATSYGESMKPEFQTRSPGSDPRSRMLLKMLPDHKPEPERLAAYNALWHNPDARRHEKTWKSEHVGEYQNWVGHKYAPTLDPRLAITDSIKVNTGAVGVQGEGAFN